MGNNSTTNATLKMFSNEIDAKSLDITKDTILQDIRRKHVIGGINLVKLVVK